MTDMEFERTVDIAIGLIQLHKFGDETLRSEVITYLKALVKSTKEDNLSVDKALDYAAKALAIIIPEDVRQGIRQSLRG